MLAVQAVSVGDLTGRPDQDAAVPTATLGAHMTFTIPNLPTLDTRWTTIVAAAVIVAVAVLAIVVTVRAVRAARADRGAHSKSHATAAYYIVATVAMGVSLDTSYRFFGDKLHITGAERVGLFSVVDLALIACGLGMRANARRIDPATGRPASPGSPRMLAWLLCGFAGYAALVEAGPVAGLARVCAGPLLAMWMLHLALGIEVVNRGGHRTGAWARLVSELRERVLSLFGVGDNARDSITQARERAIRRVVRLSLVTNPRLPNVWRARITRAVRVSGVDEDKTRQARLVRQIQVAKHAAGLAHLDLGSPWDGFAAKTRPADTVPPTETTRPLPPVTPPPPANGVSTPVPAGVVQIPPPHTEWPDWLTPGMKPGDAMRAALDHYGEMPGVRLEQWATDHDMTEFRPGLGRTVLARWRDAQRDEAAGGE